MIVYHCKCYIFIVYIYRVAYHAKMIAGKSLTFIGSENFTQTSLENNREMGLLLNGSDIGKLQAQFDKDWARAG